VPRVGTREEKEVKTEEVHDGTKIRFTHRIAALGLAIVTTTFIATSVAVMFTGNTEAAGVTLGRVVAWPLRVLF
jgi:hypothetical protein